MASIKWHCKKCETTEEVRNVSLKIKGGEVRKTGDECPSCGDRREDVTEFKGFSASLAFTDSGTGKRVSR